MYGVENVTQSENGFTREVVPCIICGVRDEEFLFNTPERLVKCRRCGLLYNNPRLDSESRKKIYAKEYFVLDTDRPGINYKAYANYIEEESLIIRSMHRRLKKIEGLCKTKGRLLDVGCATGFSLIAAKQRGWDAEGIDLSEFCAQYAQSRGLKVHQGSLKDFPGEHGTIDVITMWDYLEHSSDPLTDLKTSYALLKPKGVIVLSIPMSIRGLFVCSRKSGLVLKTLNTFIFSAARHFQSLQRWQVLPWSKPTITEEMWHFFSFCHACGITADPNPCWPSLKKLPIRGWQKRSHFTSIPMIFSM